MISFFTKVDLYTKYRQGYVDPFQKALEDIIMMVDINGIVAGVFEDDLMKGFLIISEFPYGANKKIIIYKLSDFGIQYLKMRML